MSTTDKSIAPYAAAPALVSGKGRSLLRWVVLLTTTLGAFLGGFLVFNSSQEPIDGFTVREKFSFDTVVDMATTSDLVIVGTVQQIRDGRVVGDPGGEIFFVEAIVSVDQVVSENERQSSLDTLVVEFDPTPVQIPGVVGGFPPFDPAEAWWQSGATDLMFLRDAGNGRYQLISSQGLYLVGDDQRLTPALAGDGVTESVRNMDLDAFKLQIIEGSAG